MATNGARRCVYGATGLVVGLMAGGALHAQERLVGYLEYQGRRESREGFGHLSANVATLRVDGHTHVWEPWFADLSGGVGFTARNTHQQDGSQAGVDLSGGARLRMFPRSQFPLELFAERADTRISGELVGPDYAQTVVGFTQSYAPAAGSRYAVSYRHTDREDQRVDLVPASARTTDDFLSLSLNRTLDHHQLDARIDDDRLERDAPQRVDHRQVGLVRHRYAADPALTVDTLASVVSSRTDEAVDHTRSTLQQWNTNLFWRPATTRPVLVTASFVVSGLDTESNGSGADTRTTVGTVGANWQYTPALAFRSSVNATQVHAGGESSLATLARAGLNYAPMDMRLASLFYRYAVSADVGQRTDERADLSVAEFTGTFSHGVTHARPFEGGSTSVNASQLLTTLRSGSGRADTRVTHSASADWSAAGLASYASVRVLASDTRRFELETSSFQLVNAQVAGRWQMTRLAGWQGSATVQSSRTAGPTGDTPWVSNLSASIAYRHERLFGVPLLRFTSDWRALSDELAQSTRDGFSLDHRARWSWTNRLDYIVGRMQFSVRESVGDVDGRRQSLLFFMVRRYFSQLPQ